MPLNAKSVSSLPALRGRDRTVYFDKGRGGVAGLCVRVTEAGHRSYWFRYEYQGTKHWLPLGDVTEVGLADAREQAHALRVRVGKARRAEATFPHAELALARREARVPDQLPTFERVALAWLDSDTFGRLRPATRREYERVTRKLLIPAFGKQAPNDVRREDAAAFLLDIRDGTKGRKQARFALADVTKNRKPAGVMANRARAVLGSFYGWATAEDQRQLYGVTGNPLLGLQRIYSEPEPQPRVYSPSELRSIFAATQSEDELRHLVPLIAFTLVRSNEARGAMWPEFDFERKLWMIPPERSKDRRAHMVPLSAGAIRVLSGLQDEQRVVSIRSAAGKFLFAARTKAGYMDQPQDSIAAVRQASGVEDFNLHPLRDTAVHWLIEELGVRGDVVEDLLSHTPTRLERTYRGDRRSSLAEMRTALDLWSGKLTEILANREGQDERAEARPAAMHSRSRAPRASRRATVSRIVSHEDK